LNTLVQTPVSAEATHVAGLSHCWGPRQIAGGQISAGEWEFALWAPSCEPVTLHFADGAAPVPLTLGKDGVHRARCRAAEGARYMFSAAGVRFADPASLQQAEGVEGWSVLRDLRHLAKGRPAWRGRPFDETVFCELHIGTFTPEGTFAAAARSPQLKRLAECGITAIEIMPVGQFPGQRGWGYDSVLPWAPQHSYGSPEDLAGLVAAAHDLGLMVFLDVVFNHFGPQGSMLTTICPEFFLDETNEWGKKLDYRRPEVRSYFTGCALHWLECYGFDGLRFDAVHAMEDSSDPPIPVELARTVRAVPWGRDVHLVAEDSSNQVGPYHPAAGLYDASWDDDYHHALHVLLTGETFGYYKDFVDDPLADLQTALRDGQCLQGQPRPAGQESKGEPSGHLPPSSFVNFNLNHDHAGNRPKGERLISLIGADRALVAHAFLLVAPYVPLLFMGEEIGSRQPFPWFADYAGDAARKMRKERMGQFKDLPDRGADMLDPFDPKTVEMCYPYGEREPEHAELWRQVTREVLDLRRDRLLPLFRSGRSHEAEVVAAGPRSLSATWHFTAGSLQAEFSFDGQGEGQLAAADLYRIGQAGSPWFRLRLF
jgi:maltooligosyltrehalose trehalohydrolase